MGTNNDLIKCSGVLVNKPSAKGYGTLEPAALHRLRKIDWAIRRVSTTLRQVLTEFSERFSFPQGFKLSLLPHRP